MKLLFNIGMFVLAQGQSPIPEPPPPNPSPPPGPIPPWSADKDFDCETDVVCANNFFIRMMYSEPDIVCKRECIRAPNCGGITYTPGQNGCALCGRPEDCDASTGCTLTVNAVFAPADPPYAYTGLSLIHI